MDQYQGFVGKVLDGRYKILELVGLGGMACVLKAQDLVMNRIVAIKILNEEYNGNESAEERFIDESKAVAMLSNKNIVSVYDVAIYPDIKYIVMEYLDGITLREYLDNKGVLDWKEACFYILQILRALEHAHGKGIIHRDIKPQNVMLMKNGDIKVTDFGIAKLPDSVSEQKDEKAVGTVYYISPEQACGKETDCYSDLYSVGVMFYEAVTGSLPFTAETPMEIAVKQVNEEPVHPRDIVIDIPIGVAQIILKAMEKSPFERFRSAHAMAKAIEWVLKYPDVIFAMSAAGAEESPAGTGSVVSIDMISTAELEPFAEEELANAINPKKEKPASVKKTAAKAAPRKKKRKRSTSMFPIIFGVVSAFLIVALCIGVPLAINVFTEITSPTEAPVYIFPDLTKDGVYYTTELVNNLRNGVGYGGKFVIDDIVYDARDDVENNRILDTEPKPGHESKTDEKGILHFTQITVNRTSKITVPDVLALSKTDAKTTLTNLGFTVECLTRSSDEADNPYYSNDQVIEVIPPVGTELKAEDTVTLILFKRESSEMTAEMPDLIGLNQTEAKTRAGYACYTVEFEEVPTDGGNFKVFEQSIAVGTVSPKNTVVHLKISVPLSTFLMPNLKDLTLDEIGGAISNASPDASVRFKYLYFALDEEVKSSFEIETAGITNLDSLSKNLLDYDAKQLNEYDGLGKVYFQSVLPETEIEKEYGEEITLLFITYEKREPVDISGDVSGDTSGDVSGDTSGDVSGDTSGDVSGDVSGDTSGDVSGDVSDDTSGDDPIYDPENNA